MSSSSSLGSHSVPLQISACRLQVSLSCAVLCQIVWRVAPVFVQVVSPPLGWSPLSSFLVIWSPSGDTRGPSVVFEAVDMPCPGPFHFSHIADYIYDFCPLPDQDVGLSVLLCDVEHISFHFGLCSHKFVLNIPKLLPSGIELLLHLWISDNFHSNHSYRMIKQIKRCIGSVSEEALYLFYHPIRMITMKMFRYS